MSRLLEAMVEKRLKTAKCLVQLCRVKPTKYALAKTYAEKLMKLTEDVAKFVSEADVNEDLLGILKNLVNPDNEQAIEVLKSKTINKQKERVGVFEDGTEEISDKFCLNLVAIFLDSFQRELK